MGAPTLGACLGFLINDTVMLRVRQSLQLDAIEVMVLVAPLRLVLS